MTRAVTQRHVFHLVDPSPWPFLAAFSLLGLPFGFIAYFYGLEDGLYILSISFRQLIIVLFCWWNDVIREALLEGRHTSRVIRGLYFGLVFFIISEVVFFLSFFWSFFYFSFNPSFVLGGVWPPKFLVILNPYTIPLLNTAVLLTSGVTITWCHHAIVAGDKKEAVFSLFLTLALAVYFTSLQYYEYIHAPFNISDSVYGSIFYLMTGFHGLHVIIGTLFLFVCFGRLLYNHFTREQHVGFEAAAWYWHFVDVVWIFLYLCVYVWGSY